jgi:RNA recognition motif-containing protein
MSLRVNNQVVSPETKSLWMGEIEPWMEESAIAKLYAHVTQVVSVKIIKDKMTGLPAGYGFVEFESHEMAKRVLETLNGTPVPGLNKMFRLNWAVQSGSTTRTYQPTIPNIGGYPGPSGAGDFSVYVGDLDPNVTDSILLDAFSQNYKSIISANVIVDPITKRSKKYGFVRFGDNNEATKAIYEMSGKYILSRPIKLNVGFKKSIVQQQQPQSQYSGYNQGYPSYGAGSYGAPASYPQQTGYPPQTGYQGYGSDSYAQPSYYNYGSYPSYSYPPSNTTGSGYGMSVGGKEYPTASSYGYNAPQTYSGYDTKSYMDTTPQSQSYSYGAPVTSEVPNSGYQGYGYAAQNQYDYGTQGVPSTAANEAPAPAPPAEVKEIDIDFEENKIDQIFSAEKVKELNKEYYDQLMETEGSMDIS